jgi:hypothetical protein
MIRVADEPGQSPEYIRDGGRIAADQCDEPENKEYSGDYPDADEHIRCRDF